MNAVLKEIKRSITWEMEEFETRFQASIKTNVFLLDTVMRYIVGRKGKQIRPMLVLLSAGMNGTISESTFRGASLAQLLHTATLLHDDIVDDADRRRGLFSVNTIWKNKIAVLTGDFLLSRGLLLCVENNEFELLRIVSRTVQDMSEGELLQIQKARHLDITEKVYYKIIYQKTASLIATCCSIGATSVGAPKKTVEQMSLLGEYMGMAFQLSDDLLDYGSSNIGKPTGIDIRERKITLPLIYALSKASWLEKRKIMGIIKSKNKNRDKVNKVIAYVKASGGIEYTQQHMHQVKEKAFKTLSPLPESQYKESLKRLIQFTIDRAT